MSSGQAAVPLQFLERFARSVLWRPDGQFLRMAYFLGMDGGGTRTTAWLADERGRILARTSTGPSNPLKVGFEASQKEILRAARAAIREAHLVAAVSDRRQGSALPPGRVNSERRYSKPVLEAVCLGLAGVDRPPVYRRVFSWLRKSIPARLHLLTSDAAIALRAAVGNSPAVIVISGTGSITYARDDRGNVLRSGGWGIVYDDLGSGYDLGRKAIVAALQDFDGRGAPTLLSKKVCRALNLEDITRVILRSPTPQEIAALSALVLDAAKQGDRVARALCEEAGQDLAKLALALLKRLRWLRRVVPVVCAGGVFLASDRIRQSFARHLRRHAPAARVLLLRRPAVEGALALARDLAAGR
jgi:N-acetylglucosamine kinase-like BadF-type ATPase